MSSFSSRIEVCYAFGLLPVEARRDLYLIRKARNEFGHTAKPLSFDEPAIAARCGELHHSVHEKEARARAKFTNAVLGLCSVIHFSIFTAEKLVVPSGVTMSRETKERMRKLSDAFAEAAGLVSAVEQSAKVQSPTYNKSIFPTAHVWAASTGASSI